MENAGDDGGDSRGKHMISEAPNINTLWAEAFVDELARCGVRHVVIAPGSRSTPLVIAFARHPDVVDHSVYDERSAAFFALGIAKATGKPVAVVCTSGTAGANMYPAVCEANASHVPMLILTADRPVLLRDSGAPQTMDQQNLFGTHVRFFHDVAQPEAETTKFRYIRSLACDSVARAESEPAGPVHLNFPFRKPLEPVAVESGHAHVPTEFLLNGGDAVHGRSDGRPYVERIRANRVADRHIVFSLADRIRGAKRVLLIAGPDGSGVRLRDAMNRFLEVSGLPVFAEAASQLRFQMNRPRSIISATDLFLRSEKVRDAIKPDLIIRLGATPTTKAMQTFTAECHNVPQIAIADSVERFDPDYVVSQRIVEDPAAMFSSLVQEFETTPLQNIDQSWIEYLMQLDADAVEALDMFRQHIDEAHVALLMQELSSLPDDTALFVSSGMPIRDVESYCNRSESALEMFFNRGVNGIDGITSTALGVARGRRGHVVSLTGDMAFLHDLNGLHLSRDPRIHATIIIVNSNGSEIFGLLPIERFDPPFTQHFEMPHGYDFAKAAAFFGIEHVLLDDAEKLHSVMNESGVRIIEYRIERKHSKSVRAQIADEVLASVERIPAPVKSTQQTLSIRVHRIAVAESGIPIVFLHGFTRSAKAWNDILTHLSGRTVYTIDLPGHGNASIAKMTVEDCSEEIAAFAERNALKQFHLIGYSMGGRVAMRYALAHQGTLASLTLISASPGIEEMSARDARRQSDEALAARVEREGLETFIDEWMNTPLFRGQERFGKRAVRAARAERMEQRTSGLASSLRNMGQGVMQPMWSELSSLKMPVLLIAGERDEVYREHVRSMSERLPLAHAIIMEQAGHDVPVEAWEKLGIVLSEWIDNLSLANEPAGSSSQQD